MYVWVCFMHTCICKLHLYVCVGESVCMHVHVRWCVSCICVLLYMYVHVYVCVNVVYCSEIQSSVIRCEMHFLCVLLCECVRVCACVCVCVCA
jgi:hypothetical protein